MIHKSMYLCLFELNFDEVFAANICVFGRLPLFRYILRHKSKISFSLGFLLWTELCRSKAQARLHVCQCKQGGRSPWSVTSCENYELAGSRRNVNLSFLTSVFYYSCRQELSLKPARGCKRPQLPSVTSWTFPKLTCSLKVNKCSYMN